LPLLQQLFAKTMALKLLASLPLLLSGVGSLKMDLSDANFKKSIEGKNAILFFQAPW
jgi:hypothetical protein